MLERRNSSTHFKPRYQTVVSIWLKVTENAPPAKDFNCDNCIEGCVWTPEKFWMLGGRKDLLPLQRIEPWLFGQPARSLVNIPQDNKRHELMKGTSTSCLWDIQPQHGDVSFTVCCLWDIEPGLQPQHGDVSFTVCCLWDIQPGLQPQHGDVSFTVCYYLSTLSNFHKHPNG